MKSMKMEMSNWTMMYRVRKRDQQEEVLVARTEHLSVPVQRRSAQRKKMGSYYDILGLNVDTDTDMPGEGVVCVINLAQWRILSSYLQVIERTKFSDPPRSLLKILMLSSCYFTMTLTQELTSMSYTMLRKIVIMILQLMISMSTSQDNMRIRSLYKTELLMRRWRIWRRPRRNTWS